MKTETLEKKQTHGDLIKLCKERKINFVGKTTKELISLLNKNKEIKIKDKLIINPLDIKKEKYRFTLRNKTEMTGELIRLYPYKNGITYLYLKNESGKKFLINPSKATKL